MERKIPSSYIYWKIPLIPDQAFVHLQLAIMPRDEKIMKETSEKLLAFLQGKFPKTKKDKNCSFSVEIRLLDKNTYSKAASGTL